MKKILGFWLVLSVCLVAAPNSHAQIKFSTPIEINNFVADITDSLYYLGTEWGNLAAAATESGEYAKLTPQRKKITDFLSRKKVDLILIQDINKSHLLRLAAIEFLIFQEQLVVEAFMPFEKLTATSSDAELEKCFRQLDNVAVKEEAKLQKLHLVQEVYANENGFSLEN